MSLFCRELEEEEKNLRTFTDNLILKNSGSRQQIFYGPLAKTALAIVERMGKMSLYFFHHANTLAPLGGVVNSSYRSISFLILDFIDSLVVSVLDLIFSLSLEVGDNRALVRSGLFSTVGTTSSTMLLSSEPTFFQSSSSSLFVSSNWIDSIR